MEGRDLKNAKDARFQRSVRVRLTAIAHAHGIASDEYRWYGCRFRHRPHLIKEKE
jgi:hypothetical protein